MTRPSFIQAPTTAQLGAAYGLLFLNRRLVAGRYGDLLPPELALKFREALVVFEREFQFENVGNDNDTLGQQAVRAVMEGDHV